MISLAPKILFVVSLTAFNVNLTLCDLDYGSVNSSPYGDQIYSNNQTSWTWYEYDFSKKIPVQLQVNSVTPRPTEVARDIENSWIKYKSENLEDNSTEIDNTNAINNASVDNSNAQQSTSAVVRNENVDSNTPESRSNDDSSANEPKRTSEIKCEEYGRIVGRKVWALILVGTEPEGVPVSAQNTRCEGVHTPLIVGGTEVQPGEFPHMAALGWPSDGKVLYLCGGSLISESWVLTAAHCTHGHSGSPSVVRLGTHKLSDDKLGQVFEVKRILRHPTYKPPAMYADIALLELKTSVTFNDYIRPMCLYQHFDTAPAQAWATGWGATQIGEESSDTLLKIRLDILDTVKCARQYNRSAAVPRGIVPSMVCAGDTGGNWQSDTCQGDSGGPLQIIHPTISCLYQLVGITSFGKLCALRDSPGVYTRVSQYLNWIEEIVWPETV